MKIVIFYPVYSRSTYEFLRRLLRVSVRSPWNQEFERVGFEESGKPEYPEKNLSEQLERTNNKLNPHMGSTPRPDLNPSYSSVGGECFHHCATLTPKLFS